MSTGCIKPPISKETERIKIFLPAFLAPLVRGAGAAGDGGVVFLSLSLADARQLPRQREPKEAKIFQLLSRGSRKN